jgi:hypothetical protein
VFDLEKEEKQLFLKFSWKISCFFHEEIGNHIEALRQIFEKKITRQNWIENAIREKLERQESFGHYERIGFKMDLSPFSEFDKTVKKIQNQLGKKYSKQQFMLEAIQEKLDLEEEITKIKALRYMKNINKLKKDYT